MSTLDQILGRAPIQVEESVVPAMSGRTRPASMLRRQTPKDEEEKKLRNNARKSTVVAMITGMTESDGEGIIPDNAKPIDAFGSPDIPGMGKIPDLDAKGPSEPSTTSTNSEELIQPTAALVAPDVTPKIFDLIDPSQVPAPPKPSGPPPAPTSVTQVPTGAEGTLDTLLGRQNPASNIPAMTAESFMHVIDPAEIHAKAAADLVPAAAGGSAMPKHKEGTGREIYSAFRNIMG